MDIIWNEASIRKVFMLLDEKTGLCGAELPITFGNTTHRLGSFSVENGGVFYFSKYWFENAVWPFESAIDVIRHEYAHYMNWIIYKSTGHRKTWKKCCSDIGAVPVRLYSDERSEYYRMKHQKKK